MKTIWPRFVCLLGAIVLTATAAMAQASEAGRSSATQSGAQALTSSVREALRERIKLAGSNRLDVGARAADQSVSPSALEPQSGRQPQGQPPAKPPQAPVAPLTLEELLNAVELFHPKLRGADAQRRTASAKRLEKQGAFDPVFTTGSDYLRFNTEFDAKTQRGKVASTRLADAGVEFLTPSGIKIGGGTRFNLGKVKAPLSPTGDAGEYFLEFKMPLARGWRINEKSVAERQAFLGEPLADAEFQVTRLDLLLKAATSYWDWVAAKQKLDVARGLLSLAEFRVRAVADRAAAGDLPRIDVTEAELEVQRRQGGVVKADRDLQKAAFKLSLFLWSPNGLPAPLPREAEAPAAIPSPSVLTDDCAEAGRRMALDRRPELKAININRDIMQVDLELAKNQRRPAIDLAFSPGRDAGLGAIGNTVKASVSFSLPLRQRTADGRIAAADLKIQKLDFDLTSERQRVTTEVMDAASAINTAYDRYQAALREVELAVRLEQGERDKFTLGDSTLFLVNQRERATVEARVKLIEIQVEYEQAVAAFRAATVQY